MAFWAIEKVKNFKGMISAKDIGSKIANNAPEQQTQSSFNARKSMVNSKELSDEQLFLIQIKQYKSLCSLEREVAEQMIKKKREQYQDEEHRLMEELEKINKQIKVTKQEQEKRKLIQALAQGKKSVKDLMQENLMMKEKLYIQQTEPK